MFLITHICRYKREREGEREREREGGRERNGEPFRVVGNPSLCLHFYPTFLSTLPIFLSVCYSFCLSVAINLFSLFLCITLSACSSALLFLSVPLHYYSSCSSALLFLPVSLHCSFCLFLCIALPVYSSVYSFVLIFLSLVLSFRMLETLLFLSVCITLSLFGYAFMFCSSTLLICVSAGAAGAIW